MDQAQQWGAEWRHLSRDIKRIPGIEHSDWVKRDFRVRPISTIYYRAGIVFGHVIGARDSRQVHQRTACYDKHDHKQEEGFSHLCTPFEERTQFVSGR
ncbi:MAG: hypothetical protein M5U29_09325 [Anaerolineae bacterium]|nr:hypothetical protein [Anaerolineae bacterium]